jgi:hypothetical protein
VTAAAPAGRARRAARSSPVPHCTRRQPARRGGARGRGRWHGPPRGGDARSPVDARRRVGVQPSTRGRRWWLCLDSNQGHTGYEPGALPTELHSQIAAGLSPTRRAAPPAREGGCGGWIRTNDLRVMSPTSFHCSTPPTKDTAPGAGVRPRVSAQRWGVGAGTTTTYGVGTARVAAGAGGTVGAGVAAAPGDATAVGAGGLRPTPPSAGREAPGVTGT